MAGYRKTLGQLVAAQYQGVPGSAIVPQFPMQQAPAMPVQPMSGELYEWVPPDPAVAQMQQAIPSMQRDIAAMKAATMPRGGPVHPGLYEEGIPIYTAPLDVSSGGILQSDIGTLPIAATAGMSAIIPVSGEYLARLYGTVWALCSVFLGGDISDPEESGKCVVSATINGARVNTLYQTPLDTLAPNLFGTIFGVPVERLVPAASNVQFEVEVVDDLTTTDISRIRFRLYSGNEIQWGHAVGGL